MNQPDLLKQIVSALDLAKMPARFFAEGTVPTESIEFAVDGCGPLKFPIQKAMVKKLAEAAVQAPYGKKTETIVDPNVRNTLEISADAITLSEPFQRQLKSVVEHVAKEMNLELDRLHCELYKLLIYSKRGFFEPRIF